MVKNKFDLALLKSASSDVIAWLIPAVKLFGWMRRTIEVPSGWSAFGTRDDQDPLFVKSRETFVADGVRDLLFVRNEPISCRSEMTGLHSSDGYVCNGVLEVNMRVIEDSAEIAAFRHVIMGSADILRQADLQRHIEWEMRRILTELAALHSVADLTKSIIDSDEVQRLVHDRLGSIALSAGLTLETPMIATFESLAYRDHCREQHHIETRTQRIAAQQRIQQALAHAQKEHLGHLTQLLQQLAKVAESHADFSMADLLRTFNESQRSELYNALWKGFPPARPTRCIAVVSEQELLLLDRHLMDRSSSQSDERTESASQLLLSQSFRRVLLPNGLGPLRSVSVDERTRERGWLLVGARTGVFVVNWQRGEVVYQLRWSSDAVDDVSRDIAGGINAMAMSESHVYATHSELGLLSWPLSEVSSSLQKSGDLSLHQKQNELPAISLFSEITTGASTIRGAMFSDGYLWFSVDEEIWAWSPTELKNIASVESASHIPTLYRGNGYRIASFTVAAGRLYAGTAAGHILMWDDIDEPTSWRVLRGPTGRPIESIDLVTAGSLEHLIVADRSSGLSAIMVDDVYVRTYESGGIPVRRAATADDWFAAMNDNRDRLIVWDSRCPDKPAATVVVPHLTGGPIQDVAIMV